MTNLGAARYSNSKNRYSLRASAPDSRPSRDSFFKFAGGAVVRPAAAQSPLRRRGGVIVSRMRRRSSVGGVC